MDSKRYSQPCIEDHGSLCDLTQRLDLMIPVGLVRAAAGVAVSGIITHPGGGGHAAPTGAADVLGGSAGGGGSPGGVTQHGAAVNGLSGSGGASPGSGAAGGAAGGGAGGGGGGGLPFTGYAAALVSLVGAGLLITGASLRARLRRLARRPEAGS